MLNESVMVGDKLIQVTRYDVEHTSWDLPRVTLTGVIVADRDESGEFDKRWAKRDAADDASAFWESINEQRFIPIRDKKAKAKDDGFDPVTKPKGYNSHPSGLEAIQVTEHYNFCLGNALKYIWRHEYKGGLQDLKKAQWYLNREIERREKEAKA